MARLAFALAAAALSLSSLPRPAAADFVGVSAASGFLATPAALFLSLFSAVTLSTTAGLNSTCYVGAAAERAAVAAIPLWDLVNGSAAGAPDAVHRLFLFADFRTCFLFMSQAAAVFDRNDHHPVQTNVYNQVDMVLSTDDRKCLSTFDVATAAALDAIFARRTAAAPSNDGGDAPVPIGPGGAAGIAATTLLCIALVVGTVRYLRRDGGGLAEGGSSGGSSGAKYGAL